MVCKEVDFDEFTPTLQTFLDTMRENQKLKKESKKNASASTQEPGKSLTEKMNDSIDELEKDGDAEEEDPAVAGVETHETGDESLEMDEVNRDNEDTSQGHKRQKISE